MDIFKNKVLLVTGGTGSFGNAVVEKLLDSSLKEIRIFSRDEKKQFDMKNKYCSDKLKFYIGNVRDRQSVDLAMKNVDFVFHAAAMKHVPICEEFPDEAYKTNVEGTINVLDSAINNNVKKVIVLSTDKAVYPTSTMGVTKKMAENVAIQRSEIQKNTIICRTRFGNVMGSRGSVIPLFKEQALSGKDITITNKDMTRYMMTIEEAVGLVLFAFKNGRQGDLFVKKAPSATVYTIAVAIKELIGSGSRLVNIGCRKGEKMHETLMSKEEACSAEEYDDYFRINTNKPFTLVDGVDGYTSYNSKRLDVSEMKKVLMDNKLI